MTLPAPGFVRVFGPGTGESVVIGFPENRWVVVDCLRQAGINPVRDFLESRHATRVDLLVLTHPHADHYRGMIDILDHFEVGSLWKYPGQSVREIHAWRDLAKAAGDPTRMEEADELARLFRTIEDRVVRRRISPHTCHESGLEFIVPENQDHWVRSIGPAERDHFFYDRAVIRLFDEDGKLRADPGAPDPNTVSCALVVRLHGVRVLLGGDVLAGGAPDLGWKHLHPLHQEILRGCGLIKASHHGSEGAYHAPLSLECSGAEVVVTPFRSSSLPRASGLQLLSADARRLVVSAAPSLAEGWGDLLTQLPHSGAALGASEAPGGQVEFRISANGEVEVSAISFDARYVSS